MIIIVMIIVITIITTVIITIITAIIEEVGVARGAENSYESLEYQLLTIRRRVTENSAANNEVDPDSGLCISRTGQAFLDQSLGRKRWRLGKVWSEWLHSDRRSWWMSTEMLRAGIYPRMPGTRGDYVPFISIVYIWMISANARRRDTIRGVANATHSYKSVLCDQKTHISEFLTKCIDARTYASLN